MGISSVTRAKILECSKKLFSQSGYYCTQISDIVAAAKIGRGTVYQYFHNKEHIFISLLEIFYYEWETMSKLNLSLKELRVITAQDYLRMRLSQAFNYFNSDHDRANIILRASPGLGGSFEAKISRIEKKLIDNLSNDLELGIRNGHVYDKIDVEFVSNFVAGAIFRISLHYFVRNKGSKKSRGIQALIKKAYDMVAPSILIKNN